MLKGNLSKNWLLGPLLAASLLAGCNSSSSDFVVTGNPPPPLAPLPLSRQTSSAAASAMLRAGDVDFLVPVNAAVTGRESLPLLNATHPNSSALAVASALFLMGAGNHNSPLGGSVEISQSNGGLSARFTSLDTLVGTIDGSVQVLGGANSFTAEFSDLRIASKDTVATLRGPATLLRQDGAGATSISWTANYSLTTAQGNIAFDNFEVDVDFVLSDDTISGSKSYQGALNLEAEGAAGRVEVSTQTPFTFSGPFGSGTTALAVQAGKLTITGAGSISLTVGAQGVALAGPDGSTIKTVPWAYLGGSIDASNALRPLVADTIFGNATVITVDSDQPGAEALASMDGRLLAVGSAAEIAEFQEATTTTVDLTGQTVLPGFVEPHMHTNLTALNNMSNVTPLVVNTGTYEGLSSKAYALSQVTTAVNSTPDAAAVLGYGFDPSRMVPADLMQPLTLAELDAISPTVPIVVQNSSGHISYANSAAFRAANIWPTAPNGPFTAPAEFGSNIVVDQNGLPTGQLNEFAQTPFITLALTRILEPLSAEFVQQYFEVFQEGSRVGITSAGDQLVGGVLGLPVEEGLLSQLTLTHSPAVRINGYLDSSSIEPDKSNVFAGEGNDSFRIRGAKFVTDGSTQGLTAALNFDYPAAVADFLPGPANGTLDIPDTDTLLAEVSAWHNLGFQISTHANGDRAQDQIMDVYSRLAPIADPRFLIHHFTVHTDEELDAQVARAKALGVNVSMTIGHVFYWGEVFNNLILGPEVSKNIDPAATLVEAGVNISFHSDSPITPMNPLLYIDTAVNRLWQTPPRQVLGPDQRLTREQAIRAVTLGPAHALFVDDKVGSLEVGKYTDLVVLGANPLAVEAEAIAEIPVLATYVGGVPISQAP